jgi:MFS family permease
MGADNGFLSSVSPLQDTDAWSTSTKRNSTLTALDCKEPLDNDHDSTDDKMDPSLKRETIIAVSPIAEPTLQQPHVDFDVEAKGEEETPIPETWTPTKNEWLIMISLAFISLMVALDASILVTVLPEIARKLNGTSVEAFWAGTSYLLTSAIFQPVIASISQTFGRQQLLIFSLLFFTVGTILCATSKDFTQMLTGRCIQGVGGGGIITLTQVIFCDIVPLRQRPKYFPLVLGSWSVGSILGPVVGGILTEKVSWRWCFHINYPFCGIGLIVAIAFVRLNRVAELTFAQKLKETDWIGALVFLGGMTSVLVGLSWGGIQHPWDSAATLAPIILGLFALVAFGLWQLYAKPHSLLPLSIFCNWSAIAAFYCAMINGLIVSPSYHLTSNPDTDIDPALHRAVLYPLLLHVRTRQILHQRRQRHASSSVPPDPRIHHRFHPNVPTRTFPLGNLGRLARHNTRMWTAVALRRIHKRTRAQCCSCRPGNRNRHGLDKRQRRHTSHFKARRLRYGGEYVWLFPQFGDAAWCCALGHDFPKCHVGSSQGVGLADRHCARFGAVGVYPAHHGEWAGEDCDPGILHARLPLRLYYDDGCCWERIGC